MPRPPYNRSRDERYFNAAGTEPEVRCSVETCPERTWEPWMWAACETCGLPTCPDHLAVLDGIKYCAPCADAERAYVDPYDLGKPLMSAVLVADGRFWTRVIPDFSDENPLDWWGTLDRAKQAAIRDGFRLDTWMEFERGALLIGRVTEAQFAKEAQAA